MRFRSRAVLSVIVALIVSAGAASPAGAAPDVVGFPGDFDEDLFGTSARELLDGLGGDDHLFGKQNPRRKKPEVQLGGAGADMIFPGPGRDKADGGEDADQIFDNDGAGGNTLLGGDGDDALVSLDGAKDKLDCGPGNDSAIADPKDKVKNCEVVVYGSTRAYLSGALRDVLVGTAANDPPHAGTAAHEVIIGLNGADDLHGAGGTDVVIGGLGADTVSGDIDQDVLIDDDGTPGDTINGGDGDDYIFAIDNAADNIDCGGGFDRVYVDVADILTNCGGDSVHKPADDEVGEVTG